MRKNKACLEVSVDGKEALGGSGQVEVVAPRDGHVQEGVEVGDQLRVEPLGVLGPIQQERQGEQPPAQDGHCNVVNGQMLEQQVQGRQGSRLVARPIKEFKVVG